MESTVTADTWRGQLNFNATCTSSGPQERCSLASDLSAWNRVLYGLQYELAEHSPGKFSLRHSPNGTIDKRPTNAVQETAFLISWLVEHHGCIDELSVTCASRPAVAASRLAPIRLRRPPGKGIRSLEINFCAVSRSYYYLPQEDIDALRGIEELKIKKAQDNDIFSLLRHNADSIKSVQVTNSKFSDCFFDALQRLEKCQSVTVEVCTYEDEDAVTQLARSLPTIQKFTLYTGMFAKWNVSAVANALNANVSLTTLEIYLAYMWTTPRDLFFALGSNTSVKRLLIGRSNMHSRYGRALASALNRNTCLLDLVITDCDVADGFMEHVALALSRNTTLERLEFWKVKMEANAVLTLCEALRENKTLKELRLPPFEASDEERRSLAEHLAHGDGYSRVVLPTLVESDLAAVSTLLASTASCPDLLGQVDICRISEATLKLLFHALAASSGVRTVSVRIDECLCGEKATALWQLLRSCRSVRCIIVEMSDTSQFVQQLLDAVEANRSISELSIFMGALGPEPTAALLAFLARNRTITTLELLITSGDIEQWMEEASEVMSPAIIEFRAGIYFFRDPSYSITETLRRNRSGLNRAVEFVLLRCKDRQCAEAFELFFGRPCLLAHVTKTSGQTESEALLAIASAESFLRDEYLVITGVVRRSVVCHAVVSGTQCDALGADCWRAIVRYLSVSDVLA